MTEHEAKDFSRRRFLWGTAAGAAGTAVTGGVLIGGAHADADASDSGHVTTADSYPFHGAHQSGILTPTPGGKQPFSCLAAFDVTGASKTDLTALMKTLTERARYLTAGGAPADLGVGQPPADSDVLGPDVPADGLTVTLGVGASLFDETLLPA